MSYTIVRDSTDVDACLQVRASVYSADELRLFIAALEARVAHFPEPDSQPAPPSGPTMEKTE